MPYEIVKVVTKEVRDTMKTVENERRFGQLALKFDNDKSFLRQKGLMLHDTREAYVEQLEQEQRVLRFLSLGSRPSLFIS